MYHLLSSYHVGIDATGAPHLILPLCHQSPSPLCCPSPLLPSHCRCAFNRRHRCPVHCHCRRAVHRRCCCRIVVVPSIVNAIVLAVCLSLSSLPLCCRCTVHCHPSPLPLRCRSVVVLLSLPMLPLLLSLLPPPPSPAFADPFIGWFLHCCQPSTFVIACRHATIDALVAGCFCR